MSLGLTWGAGTKPANLDERTWIVAPSTDGKTIYFRSRREPPDILAFVASTVPPGILARYINADTIALERSNE